MYGYTVRRRRSTCNQCLRPEPRLLSLRLYAAEPRSPPPPPPTDKGAEPRPPPAMAPPAIAPPRLASPPSGAYTRPLSSST